MIYIYIYVTVCSRCFAVWLVFACVCFFKRRCFGGCSTRLVCRLVVSLEAPNQFGHGDDFRIGRLQIPTLMMSFKHHLDGGFKYVLCSPPFGDMIQVDYSNIFWVDLSMCAFLSPPI